MRIIKNTALTFLAAAMSITSFMAIADNDDWRAMQRSKLNAAQALVIATDKVDGQAVELEFDEDNGRGYYEIEIYTNNKKYELKVDADSGKVIESDMDRERDERSSVGLSLQQAIIIAERETQAKTKSAELKNRGGRDSYYEVDTIRKNTEYEVKIDANDGSILKIDRED
ncbi:MAG: peptidase [Alcaligenaceae bacterium]|jgi:uncharacterized membrane protein YkoI|nr:peptidase [Alcaligenaceae bacterium]HZJ96640.1 PepSY domain-containing protein [Oligella sp.]